MMRYSIRRIGKEQLQEIHDMAEIVFRHTYRDILSAEQMEYMMEWMYSLPNLRRQIEDGHVYHVAYDGERPCGYVSVQPERQDGAAMPLYHLQKIYVLPTEQGMGLGRILFQTAADFVRSEAPCLPARIELNVNRNNSAVGFYKHLGMKIMRQGDFPIGNGFYMNDYIMGLEIDRQGCSK
jgi:ribosomal protein S18 acetylase RimI-like enzyme